jgi:hypothetical protein
VSKASERDQRPHCFLVQKEINRLRRNKAAFPAGIVKRQVWGSETKIHANKARLGQQENGINKLSCQSPDNSELLPLFLFPRDRRRICHLGLGLGGVVFNIVMPASWLFLFLFFFVKG